MNITRTKFEKCLLIKPETFYDFRGNYTESYHKRWYEEVFKKYGINIEFIQDDFSFSYKNVLRGIHGDEKTWKLVSCPFGQIYYVVTCCDKESQQFGQWEAFTLDGANRHQVLVPPKHGASFLAITDCLFHYKQTTYYEETKQFTYKYNDPRFNIFFPGQNFILSKRDLSDGK